MNITEEKIDTAYGLSLEHQEFLARHIAESFNKYDSRRSKQLQDLTLIRDSIYESVDQAHNSWYSDYKSSDMYEIAQTLKSHLSESLYSHPEAMFDVAGRTPQAQKYANEQKSALVGAFEQMGLDNELEKVVNSVVEAGEATLFIGWQTKYKTIRRKKSNLEKVISADSSATTLEQKLTYEGAIVKHVPAEDFVFDSSRSDDWDSCLKIYRTKMPLSELNSIHTNNLITPEKLVKLEELQSAKSKSAAKTGISPNLEVLEAWGDLTTPDGEVFKNVLITVVEGEIIVRYEQNPYVINPFIHANIIEDPKTNRGISPLRVAIPICNMSSTILNKQLDALSLIINPPYLAPKGCFKGDQAVKPGKIIEYDAALMPNQPIPLNFDRALVGWEFIKYFKSAMETSTGIFKNMTGDYQPQSRTATEVNYSLGSQATRLNHIIDAISRKIILPMVEKTADLLAAFTFGRSITPVTRSGKTVFIEVDDKIRNNDYLYRYGDRKATLERKYKFNELLAAISQFAKLPGMGEKINWEECFTFLLEQYGIENAQNFLKIGEDTLVQP